MIRIVCFGIGYLFGLFQTSYIIGILHGFDIRNFGSGNAGTTNMIRKMGTKWGLITFLGDFQDYNRDFASSVKDFAE